MYAYSSFLLITTEEIHLQIISVQMLLISVKTSLSGEKVEVNHQNATMFNRKITEASQIFKHTIYDVCGLSRCLWSDTFTVSLSVSYNMWIFIYTIELLQNSERCLQSAQMYLLITVVIVKKSDMTFMWYWNVLSSKRVNG